MPNYQMMYNLGLLQGKAYRILDRHLSKTLAEYDLSMFEWKLMGQLYDSTREMEVPDLAQKLDLELRVVRDLVRKLRRKGYVQSKRNLFGGRSRKIYLTEKGDVLIPELEIVVHQLIKKLLAGTTAPEKLIYLRFLLTIVKNGEDATFSLSDLVSQSLFQSFRRSLKVNHGTANTVAARQSHPIL